MLTGHFAAAVEATRLTQLGHATVTVVKLRKIQRSVRHPETMTRGRYLISNLAF
jgi:hypothetical protein